MAFDDFGLWRRNLSASEIWRIYQEGLNGTPIPSVGDVSANALADDMVVYLNFDETSGDVLADTSPRGNTNSADVIGANLGSTSVAGLIGNAYEKPSGETGTDRVVIDGTPGNSTLDSSLPTDMQSPDADASFSWSCWVTTDNINVSATAGDDELLGNVNWDGVRSGTGCLAGTTQMSFRAYPGDGSFVTMFTGAYPATGWVHLGMTVDRQTRLTRLFMNGSEVDSATFNAYAGHMNRTDCPWAFGAEPFADGNDNEGEQVAFDEFAWWQRALSPTEMAEVHTRGSMGMPLYEAPRPIEQDMVAYLNFDEQSGTVYNDYSTNGSENDADVIGTAINGTTSVAGVVGNAYQLPVNGVKDDDLLSIDGTPGNATRDASLPSDFLSADDTENLSYSVWINMGYASDVTDEVMGNINWRASPSDRSGIGMLGGSSTRQAVRVNMSGDTDNNHVFGLFYGDGWHHMVYSVDRATGYATIYIDGQQGSSVLVSDNSGAIGDSGVPFVFGANPMLSSTETPEGIIWDEFAFWRREITASEAQELYLKGLAGQPLLNVYTVAFQTDGTAGSSITGDASQQVTEGQDASAVTAVPPVSHDFVNWTDGGSPYSTDNPLTVTNVTTDTSLVANFAIKQFTLTYGDDGNGSVTGTSPQTVDYGQDGTQVTAVPNSGYNFVRWSDGITSNPRTDTNVTADVNVIAEFALNSFTLTYLAGPNGSITGVTPQTVPQGSNGTTVTAVGDTGYHFVDWSDGSTQNPRRDLNITGDLTVTANFAINEYTLTYTAGTGGSITGTSPQTVTHGSDGTQVTAVADANYDFVDWSDGSTDNPRTDLNVTGDIDVTANFTLETFAVTFDPGTSGTISGTNPQTVEYGTNSDPVTAVPDAGYAFLEWDDGSTENPRVVNNVTTDVVVTALWTTEPSPKVWDGGGGDSVMNTATNWVGDVAPGVAETMVWQGLESGDLNLTYTGEIASLGQSYRMSTSQTANLTISNSNAADTNNFLRLTNDGSITIEEGAGAFTFGGPLTGRLILGNGALAEPFYFRNDSASTATIGENVSILRGNGVDPSLVFRGSGVWDVAGTIEQPGTDPYRVIKEESGLLVLRGANTYTNGNSGVDQGTAVRGGTLAVAHDSALGTTDLSFNVTGTGNTARFQAYGSEDRVLNNYVIFSTDAILGAPGTGDLTFTAGALGGSIDKAITVDGIKATIQGGLTGSGDRTKLGDGTLALPGDNTAATGRLLVEEGTLDASGTLGSELLSVSADGALAIADGISTLSVLNDATLAGTVRMEIDRDAATYTADRLEVAPSTGTLTLGGTLEVSSLGSAPQLGDSFDLFDAATISGSFSSYVLPPLGAGLGWDTSQVATTGEISVVSGFTVTFLTDGTAGATIEGPTVQSVASGADTAPVLAVEPLGFAFSEWTSGTATYSTDNPLTLTNVTEDITLTANFATGYTLTYLAGPNGSISGDAVQGVLPGGDGQAVTAVGDEGYAFVEWSDGSTDNPRTDTNVTTDVTVTASFDFDTSDLVVYYTFDETDGLVVNDLSLAGDDNDGDLIGTSFDAGVSTSGLIGAAYVQPRDGVVGNDFISLDGNPRNRSKDSSLPSDLQLPTTSTSLSFSVWLKTDNAESGAFGVNPASTGDEVMGNIDYTVAEANRSGVSMLGTGGTYGTRVTASGSADQNQLSGLNMSSTQPTGWHHFLGVVNRETGFYYLYVDGSLVGTANIATETGAIGNPAVPWVFGTRPFGTANNEPEGVAFDEFGVWRKALSTTEALLVYQRGLDGKQLVEGATPPPPPVTPTRAGEGWMLYR